MNIRQFPKTPRIKDKQAIEKARKDYCEVCGKPTNGIMPHHIYTRGAGSPDAKENLIQLDWDCHYVEVPNGKLSKDYLLSIVARRENKTVEELKEIINKLRYGG